MTYLLVGFGQSNQSIARHLITSGLPFDIFSDSPFESPFVLPEQTKTFHDISQVDGSTYVALIKSPGIAHSHPIFDIVKTYRIPLHNEISFSLPYVTQPLLAITGTNGKTTVTSLVAHILADKKARAVGNIGHSFSTAAMLSNNLLVLELSSFQLKDLTNFSPDVSAFLNFQPSHLDYHLNEKDYKNSKANIVKTQDPNKPFVYNLDDPEVSKMADKRGGNLRSFSLVDPSASAFFDGFNFYVYGDLWLNKEDLLLFGNHNYQNILAAILIAYSYESKSTIVSKIKTFAGVEHRLEGVPNNLGFRVFNDSKSTNPASTISAVNSFESPVVLILGGKDRGNDFSHLLKLTDKIHHLALFGEVGPQLYQLFKDQFSVSLHQSVTEATQFALTHCSPVNALLFSPGCASWDQFKNFEERGLLFKKTIHEKNLLISQ